MLFEVQTGNYVLPIVSELEDISKVSELALAGSGESVLFHLVPSHLVSPNVVGIPFPNDLVSDKVGVVFDLLHSDRPCGTSCSHKI